MRHALAATVLCLALPDAIVYHGKLEGAEKPAEVVAATVFGEIAEYKKIKEKGLKDGDAEYWVLLNKANERFRSAVAKAAGDAKHDVVVEKGSHKFSTTPPDLTRAAIEALEAK